MPADATPFKLPEFGVENAERLTTLVYLALAPDFPSSFRLRDVEIDVRQGKHKNGRPIDDERDVLVYVCVKLPGSFSGKRGQKKLWLPSLPDSEDGDTHGAIVQTAYKFPIVVESMKDPARAKLIAGEYVRVLRASDKVRMIVMMTARGRA